MYTAEVERFKTAVNSAVDNVDKTYLRDLQADSHECAATCCRDKYSAVKTVLQCVENCGEKLQTAQQIVLKEFDRLEDRFQRCLLSCSESGLPDGETNEKQNVVTYNGCIRRCVDANIEIIPDILRSIKEAFNGS